MEGDATEDNDKNSPADNSLKPNNYVLSLSCGNRSGAITSKY